MYWGKKQRKKRTPQDRRRKDIREAAPMRGLAAMLTPDCCGWLAICIIMLVRSLEKCDW